MPVILGNGHGEHETCDPQAPMAKLISLALALWFAIFAASANSSLAQPALGDAPIAPADVSGLPGRGPRPLVTTGNLNVDPTSREQSREFYNAVYMASTGVPIGSSAVTATCFPGTNSTAFVDATLLRINWFRAMAGVPAIITFDSDESADDQDAALMMSAQGALQHVGNWIGWACYTSAGTNASANSNLALGYNGPDAATAYVWDFGANNYLVGHRRQLLYPQTQIMATGDMPAEGTNLESNATWVFDANYFDPRPATRNPFVAWPPPGYVPYQVVYPQWSFAVSNANLSAATVTMSSNGVPITITQQPYAPNYGENAVVWYPSNLDPTSGNTLFPFNGTDTVYAIIVSGVVVTNGARTATNTFTYNVTVFDPAPTGPGYVPLVISGTNTPSISVGNAYRCTPASNPNTTGYQWRIAAVPSGNFVDNALNGLTNFTISPTPPPYPVITNAPDGSGNCFHLTHYILTPYPVPQLLPINEVMYPSTNTTISFKSLLGYASTNEFARLQISTNSGTSWANLFSEAGTNDPGETTFTKYTFSLSNYSGDAVLARFNYDLSGGLTYYDYDFPFVGWCIENVVVTNCLQLQSFTTNATSSTNFNFTPGQTNSYVLQAQAVIFNEFPLDWGPPKLVTAIIGPAVINLSAPAISSGQVKIKFTLAAGVAPTFHLLQANQLTGPWTTNGTAALATNVAGSSWTFTTTNGPAMRFYRVQTP
jgi:hypothetical protein